VIAFSLSWSLLGPALRAQDLSAYRSFRLGTDLPTVAKQAELKLQRATTVYDRPALLQDLRWERYGGPSRETDALQEILFSFYDGQLYRIVVTYDRERTQGLTADDMVAALSVMYGTANRPDDEINFPYTYNQKVKVIARWEDATHSVNLVRSTYMPTFGLVMHSKPVEQLAVAATAAALQINEQEAPQRAIARQHQLDEETRAREEKARKVNRETFRP
jgi:hypothetical protein